MRGGLGYVALALTVLSGQASADFDAGSFFGYIDQSCVKSALTDAGKDVGVLVKAAQDALGAGSPDEQQQKTLKAYFGDTGGYTASGFLPKKNFNKVAAALGDTSKKYSIWCDGSAMKWVTTEQEGDNKDTALPKGRWYIPPDRRPANTPALYFDGDQRKDFCKSEKDGQTIEGASIPGEPWIFLCDGAFNLAKPLHDIQDKKQKAGTTIQSLTSTGGVLLHEFCHVAFSAPGPGEIYGPVECINAAQDSKRQGSVKNNADSHMLFSMASYFDQNDWSIFGVARDRVGGESSKPQQKRENACMALNNCPPFGDHSSTQPTSEPTSTNPAPSTSTTASSVATSNPVSSVGTSTTGSVTDTSSKPMRSENATIVYTSKGPSGSIDTETTTVLVQVTAPSGSSAVMETVEVYLTNSASSTWTSFSTTVPVAPFPTSGSVSGTGSSSGLGSGLGTGASSSSSTRSTTGSSSTGSSTRSSSSGSASPGSSSTASSSTGSSSTKSSSAGSTTGGTTTNPPSTTTSGSTVGPLPVHTVTSGSTSTIPVSSGVHNTITTVTDSDSHKSTPVPLLVGCAFCPPDGSGLLLFGWGTSPGVWKPPGINPPVPGVPPITIGPDNVPTPEEKPSPSASETSKPSQSQSSTNSASSTTSGSSTTTTSKSSSTTTTTTTSTSTTDSGSYTVIVDLKEVDGPVPTSDMVSLESALGGSASATTTTGSTSAPTTMSTVTRTSDSSSSVSSTTTTSSSAPPSSSSVPPSTTSAPRSSLAPPSSSAPPPATSSIKCPDKGSIDCGDCPTGYEDCYPMGVPGAAGLSPSVCKCRDPCGGLCSLAY